MQIRLAACLMIAVVSGPVLADGDTVPPAEMTATPNATSRDANPRAGAAAKATTGENGEVGAASGEPRHSDPGAPADTGAEKKSTWFPKATLGQFDSERSTG